MARTRRSRQYLLAAVWIAACSGCNWSKAYLEAKPAGFVTRRAPDALGIVASGMPFQYVWMDPDFDTERLTFRERGGYRLFVAPVGTGYLKLDPDSTLGAAATSIATYLQTALVREIDEHEGGSLDVTVVDDRAEADFALEIELTEIGLGSPILYAAAWAIPLPGIATAYDASHAAALAIEARVVRPDSSRIVAEMSDRKIPTIRILDLKKLISRSLPLREIAGDWAIEFARAACSHVGQDPVEGTAVFTLVPW